MKSNKLQFLAAFITAFLIIVFPLAIAHAASAQPGKTGINNPLQGNATLDAFIPSLLRLVFLFGTMIVVFFIILAGFKYVTASGNPTKIADANKTLLYCAIGAVILLGAQTIADVISNTVKELGSK